MMNFLTRETLKSIAADFDATCQRSVEKIHRYSDIMFIDDWDLLRQAAQREIENLTESFDALKDAIFANADCLQSCRPESSYSRAVEKLKEYGKM